MLFRWAHWRHLLTQSLFAENKTETKCQAWRVFWSIFAIMFAQGENGFLNETLFKSLIAFVIEEDTLSHSVTIEPIMFCVFIDVGIGVSLHPQMDQLLMERTYTVQLMSLNTFAREFITFSGHLPRGEYEWNIGRVHGLYAIANSALESIQSNYCAYSRLFRRCHSRYVAWAPGCDIWAPI